MSVKSIILFITIFLFTSTIHSQEQSLKDEIITHMIIPCYEYSLENNEIESLNSMNKSEAIDTALKATIEDIEPYIDRISSHVQEMELEKRLPVYEFGVSYCMFTLDNIQKLGRLTPYK